MIRHGAAIPPQIPIEETGKMTAKTAQVETLGTKLIGRWEQAAAKLETLARELPAEKWETRPVESIRTFGDVLRHVAFWNQYVAASARGAKFDDSLNELPQAQYASKADVLAVLKSSAADAAEALREREQAGGLEPGTAEMVVMFLEHTAEHYGQLVVYARANGVVPPASRG
jgi:uncharacterized damage-inducible protein DinB